MQWLSKWIYFKLLGWRVTGFTDLNTVKKAVIIAAPHTHWYDFPIGVLLRSFLGVKVTFVAKKSLFKWPYGWIFKALGGAPIERVKNETKFRLLLNCLIIMTSLELHYHQREPEKK